MHQKPQISVILPVFNDEKFISLNFDKIEEINNILTDENLTRYRFDLSDLDKFMNFYGSSSTKKFDKLDNKIELRNNIKDQVSRDFQLSFEWYCIRSQLLP